MKKFYVFNLTLTLGVLIIFPHKASLQEEGDMLQSLRGSHSIEATSKNPTWKRLPADHDSLKRDFLQQPPLIPHRVEGYRVNLKFNKCLTCHSWANYKEAKATKISQTHFQDRDGNDLANISATRYFCSQCHVPQVDAKPLVENTFEPVKLFQ